MDDLIFLILSTSLMALFVALCWTGIIINAVLLVVFVKHPEIRTPENVPLVNLCISDIVYLLSFCMVVPSFLVYSKASCLVVMYCRSFMIALNVYSVVAISIQRYVGLTSLKNRLPGDKSDYRNSFLIIAAVWIIAGILAAVEILLIMHQNNIYLYCFAFVIFGETLYRLLAYAVVPSVTIAAFYSAASCRVNQSVQQLSTVQLSATLRTLRDRRKRSARILFALALVFALTYLPLFMFLYLGEIYTEVLEEPQLMQLTFLMSVLNPTFNIIALCLSSTQIRQLYKKHCCCGCCERSSAVPR